MRWLGVGIDYRPSKLLKLDCQNWQKLAHDDLYVRRRVCGRLKCVAGKVSKTSGAGRRELVGQSFMFGT